MEPHFPLEVEKGCQASCRVGIGIWGFFSRCQGLSQLPLCFELIHAVPVESVQGNQAYLEWMGKWGSFGIDAQLPGIRWSFKVRRPALEGRWQHRDSFTNKTEESPLI